MPKLAVILASTRDGRQGPDGVFHGPEPLDKAASTMLDELARWSSALAGLRAGAR